LPGPTTRLNRNSVNLNTKTKPYGDKPLPEILKTEKIDAVITRGKGQVNKELMEACPHLQVAARCGVGLDNVDVKEATLRGIKVINAPGSNAATIAEHTLALMLMLMRNMVQSTTKVKEGEWSWRSNYQGDELSGKTLGILGLGNIGKRVARLAEAFGMKVIVWSRSGNSSSYESLSLEEVLLRSDVLSLHLPLTEETRSLLRKERLSLMKPAALLINTARGGIIDHGALLSALNNNQLAGFAADVLAEEPPAENDPLVLHPNTLITPHVGSLTATTYRNMCLYTVQNVLAILSGEEAGPQCIFNRKELGL
jgi:D-3-phosphoglycerate dehydrogenase